MLALKKEKKKRLEKNLVKLLKPSLSNVQFNKFFMLTYSNFEFTSFSSALCSTSFCDISRKAATEMVDVICIIDFLHRDNSFFPLT